MASRASGPRAAAVAIGPVHLMEPKLRQAIEAITKANPLGVAG